MLSTRPITPDLTLSNNYRLRLTWSEKDHPLSIEVWKPGTGRDGHGYTYTADILLSGEDLASFVGAIESLPLLPTAA